mmetsp:Transcript_28996/g.52806  ORF Transcript_28996/g.52806 Transcript_28996/m.52806 type:complete len:216 (-) Transcript_28996:74-721(-)
MSSWDGAGIAWKRACSGAWLWKHASLCTVPAAGRVPRDKTLEDACAELLACFKQYAVAGVALSRSWEEFFGDDRSCFRPPDRPGQRVPFNLERYAENYCNIIFAAGVALAAASHPVSFIVLTIAQGLAVLAPPHVFEIDILLPKGAGGTKAVGGAWLRLVVAAAGHGGTWLLMMISRPAKVGVLIGAVASLLHALYRRRPKIAVAKDMLKGTKAR